MAKRRVIISERDNIAALFEGDQALEFIIHRGDILLGDVYLAEVENILPSIDAAFVNVGGDKMGFLHSSDVQGKGDLKTRLKPKQRQVVQVMKEPTGHKGPRVTTNISLPGRFLVLMPESRGVSISRKIESAAERNRLKSLVSLIKPSGVGIIIRTEADNVSETDIQEDFEVLIERWQNIVSMADSADPPSLLYRDQDLLYRVVRETVNEDVNELVVDTSFGFQRAQQLLQNWNLDKAIKVTQYTGQQSIMVAMGVEREIKNALQTKVPLPSGGYLYIQPTEALCVVDVNSGRFTSLQSQADTIRITNLESCKEVARQLRLRNIGGMIVVDFIDMDSRADQLAILQAFEAALADDKAKPQLGQLTDLGLVEMTRHRQGQALSEIFTRNCVHCTGTGHMMDSFSWASSNAPEGEGKGFDFRNRRSNSAPRATNKAREGRGERDNRGERGDRSERNDRDRDSRNERGGERGDRPERNDRDRGDSRDRHDRDSRGGGGGSERDNRDRSNDRGESRSEQSLLPSSTNREGQRDSGAMASSLTADDRASRSGDNPTSTQRRLDQAAPTLPDAHALIWPRPVAPAPTGGHPHHGFNEIQLVDQFEDIMQRDMGVMLGRYLKVGYLPQDANAYLSRYNPRVNDIFTLVASIEGGTSPTAPPDDDTEGGHDDSGRSGDGGEGDDDTTTHPGQSERNAEALSGIVDVLRAISDAKASSVTPPPPAPMLVEVSQTLETTDQPSSLLQEGVTPTEDAPFRPGDPVVAQSIEPLVESTPTTDGVVSDDPNLSSTTDETPVQQANSLVDKTALDDDESDSDDETSVENAEGDDDEDSSPSAKRPAAARTGGRRKRSTPRRRPIAAKVAAASDDN
jgi:ribonuclease E